MDWSKSKSIFIVVFLILDIFLYSLYVNRHTEAQQFEALGGEKDIEAKLKDDNITYNTLPINVETASYISGKVMNFNEENLQLQNEEIISVENENKLIVSLKEPVKLRNIKDATSFNEFMQTNVFNGSSYTLWEVDTENRKATFFQRVNDQTIYYNVNGAVTIYWNEKNEVTIYEQTMLEDIEQYEEEKNLLPPIQIVHSLYKKGLLKPDSRITQMKLGYSTLVQLTQTQVFVPTWEVRVTTKDNQEEEYFVNAVEGKVLDIQVEATEDEEIENEEEVGE